MLASLIAGISIAAVPPAMEYDVRSGTGMTLRMGGVPVVRGSWFQYYESDWTRGHYSSQNNQQQFETVADGYKVSFRSGDGRAYGSQIYSRQGNKLRIQYEFNWNGDRPVKVEVAAGLLWARGFQGGSLLLDQKPARPLTPSTYVTDTVEARKYGSGFSEALFSSSLGRLRVKSTNPNLTLFDARGYAQRWAEGRELLWLGNQGLEVRRGTPAKLEVEYELEPSAVTGKKVTRTLRSAPIPVARFVHDVDEPIIPRPKQHLFNRDEPFLIGDELKLDVPDSIAPAKQEFLRAIQRNWIAPSLKVVKSSDPNIYCRVENIGLPAEGFEIRSNKKNIIVWGQDMTGLRHGLRTLASLAFAKDGKLWFPSGTLRDWPSVSWRGVHVFGGPEMRNFQTRLAERVIGPLRFNHVVIQAERTRWESQPKIHGILWNSREDLKAVFDMYRRMGIDPIPLIQSLGHMEWFFNNGQNLDLAVNPGVPYTIDPRKPESAVALRNLWDEAIDLLKPKTVHFGLDEFANRGIPKNPAFATELWEKSVPIITEIARRKQVEFMIWGDQGLAPGQAIDAALGDDPYHAKRRRDALPEGAYIADWHYKNDFRPDRFMWSLNLWKDSGFRPIASGWFNPDNILGFTQAAYRTGAGYLQTTWAGYEHSEENMHREWRQYSALVLAADYAWSGRTDRLNELEYDPNEVLARLFYREPSPMQPMPGLSMDGGRSVRVGDFSFRLMPEPVTMLSVGSAAGANSPTEVELDTEGLKGSMIVLAVDAQQMSDERDPVADIDIELADGTVVSRRLLYGVNVRTATDRREVLSGPRENGIGAQLIALDKRSEVSKIRIRSLSTLAGLRLHGITAY